MTRIMPTPRIHALLFLLFPVLAGAQPAYLWWEAEQPETKSQDLISTHWYDARHASLSGGTSLGSNRSSSATRATYILNVPASGSWSFYVRKFWKHGPFRFRWNGGEWQTLENKTLLDSVKLKQHVINWMPAGDHILQAGRVTLEIQAVEKWGAFAIDCFVLTQEPFTPMGLRRPGAKLGTAASGTWAFEPDPDPPLSQDILGLRALNESVAGVNGRVTMDADGNFKRGDGSSLRFWGVNTSVHRGKDKARIHEHARFLARRGVNLWRHHGHLNPGPEEDPTLINEYDLDAFHRGIAIMKREGLYACYSPYWATHTLDVGEGWNIDGIQGRPAGALFWEPRLQDLYKGWIKEAFTRPNPYDPDHTPLKDDPALAFFQIQNEDSLLFWTAQRIKGREKERLTQRYHSWRKEKGLPGTPELDLKYWTVDQAAPSLRETIWFFTELQRNWNREVARFLREEVGYTGLINAGNWRTAHQARLLDAERWSYAANDILGVNRYVNGGKGSASHVNPSDSRKSGYQVNKGDYFQDESVLHHPERFPLAIRQMPGNAMIIPETTWVQPMSHQSEGPFLVAAYGSLLGIDAPIWFSMGQAGYDPVLNKWQVSNPDLMGGFPAASLLFRRADVEQAPPSLVEQRPLKSLWALEPALLPEESGFDPNRDQFDPEDSVSKLDPLLFLVGPVHVTIGGTTSSYQMTGVDRIERGRHRVTSSNGQVQWRYQDGVCLINSPRAQGVCGFLKHAGSLNLKDLEIRSQNDYATLLLISLDDQPLSHTRKALLQVTTRSRPYGWHASGGQTYAVQNQSYTGHRIENLGGPPWNVEMADLTFRIRNPLLKQMTPLNPNLEVASDPLPLQQRGTPLPKGYLYFILTP